MNKQRLPGYHAAEASVAYRDLSDRGKLRIVGPDRVSFLHAMISNEVEQLPVLSGRYGTFLTATAKIIADFWYFRFSDSLLIDVSSELVQVLKEKLESFIIMDDVEILDVSHQLSHLTVQGPKSAKLVSSLLSADPPDVQGEVKRIDWGGRTVCLIRKNELAATGFEVLVPREVFSEFLGKLEDSGQSDSLEVISDRAFEVLRMERGIPLYGVDMTDRNNPIEAGIGSSYSLTKGCYPGQEVIAKATNIGGVARLLTHLRLSQDAAVETGARVYSGDGKDVGWVTSATYSPRLGATLLFAYLKRLIVTAKREVFVETPSGRIEAEFYKGS